jgi:hypothetical protein
MMLVFLDFFMPLVVLGADDPRIGDAGHDFNGIHRPIPWKPFIPNETVIIKFAGSGGDSRSPGNEKALENRSSEFETMWSFGREDCMVLVISEHGIH